MSVPIKTIDEYVIKFDTERNVAPFILYKVDANGKEEYLNCYREYKQAAESVYRRQRVAKKKSEPLDILSDEGRKGRVTSIDEKGQVWVSWTDPKFGKDRQKIYFPYNGFLKHTEENLKKFIQLKSLSQQMHDIKESMERWDREFLKKHFGAEDEE